MLKIQLLHVGFIWTLAYTTPANCKLLLLIFL